jgi:UDP-2,3-diacylglucosamine pyrophosphatase LpxH
MVQDKFDKKLAEKEIRTNPKAKNKALYALSNAITDNQKTIVRKLKAKLKKGTKIISPPGNNDSKTKKLTEEFIENLIIKGLEDNPGNVQLIGKATEFFIKVKGKATEMEDEIDMEKLKEIGIVIKSGS